MVFLYIRPRHWTKNVDNQLALKQRKGGQPANSLAYIYIYIYIYICRTGARGTAFFQKTGRFGVHPKGRFGDRAFSHYKNRHFRGKVWQQQKRPKVTNCPLPEPRAQFCRNTHLNLCTGHLAAKPLWQGVALIKIGFFEAHIVHGLFGCTNLKIFVVKKMPSFCILQNFVFSSSGMPVFVV